MVIVRVGRVWKKEYTFLCWGGIGSFSPYEPYIKQNDILLPLIRLHTPDRIQERNYMTL